MKRLIFIFTFLLCITLIHAENWQPTFSTAGFWELPSTGREAFSMNPAWRFHCSDVKGAEQISFDDSQWKVVSLPHGIENLPMEASGCINYQGVIWYRKHFTPEESWLGRKTILHFEAIMGKSKVWINGQLVASHLGGFLPVIADVTPWLKFGEDNVIAVMADNSDDSSYPPGKFQDVLDFTYAGGIYRDCWMIVHNNIYITDPNEEDCVAGGGLFVSYGAISEKEAEIQVDLQVRNDTNRPFVGKVQYELIDRNGNCVKRFGHSLDIAGNNTKTITNNTELSNPHLWTPDDPYLYHVNVYVKDAKGKVMDGYYQRIGIRSIEFKGKEGFWLNGEPFGQPLMGANRHQDFAVIGNALPNSLHWRDAKKLRDAGLRIIRNAHYPQDPAFMDACDELGLFVIVNTPGWQYWNEDPSFAQLVYKDIRNIVRRDRNHPSVWLWEPILNETSYPADFAGRVQEIVHEEYPYPYCYAACDARARGSELYSVHFGHPYNKDYNYTVSFQDTITYFTREWGDNVDDWNSHNSPSRASRSWGEIPMLIQAQGYAKPDYPYTCYDSFYKGYPQLVGGCLWHSFDHQRGYHPDPFYGGIMDNYRQPKYSYYMFCAQRPAKVNPSLIAETGPMVYIANAMTPFSPKDVTVYSNCDEVRLTCGKNGKQLIYHKRIDSTSLPSPIITFPNAWDDMYDKKLSRERHQAESYLLAEGLMNGIVVATDTVRPARRPTHIHLSVDDEGVKMHADGSDIVTVVASVTDDQGNVKRLNNEQILFKVSGEGHIIGDASSFTNPVAVHWGTAPILIQATTSPGIIHIHASVVWEGKETPTSADLDIETYRAIHPMICNMQDLKLIKETDSVIQSMGTRISSSHAGLREVEKQQSDFEN